VTTDGVDEDAEVEGCDRTPCDMCKERGLDCKMRKHGRAGCRACNTLKLHCSHILEMEGGEPVSENQPVALQTETPETIEEQATIEEVPAVEGSSFNVNMLLEPRSEAMISEEVTESAAMEPGATRVTFTIPEAGGVIDLASPPLSAIVMDLALEEAMDVAFEGLGQPSVEANPE